MIFGGTQTARPTHAGGAFTLIELLVVVGVIAALAAVVGGGLRGSGTGVKLQAAQATISNCVAATRSRAMASGRSARLLVNTDYAAVHASARYLRFLAVQVQDASGWRTVSTCSLPEGVAILPRDLSTPTGLVLTVGDWTRPSDGAQLRSTAMRANNPIFPDAEVQLAVDSSDVESWSAIKFSPAGTTYSTGDLIVADTQPSPPSATGGAGSPIRLVSPDRARGISLTMYGLTLQVNGRDGF